MVSSRPTVLSAERAQASSKSKGAHRPLCVLRLRPPLRDGLRSGRTGENRSRTCSYDPPPDGRTAETVSSGYRHVQVAGDQAHADQGAVVAAELLEGDVLEVAGE